MEILLQNWLYEIYGDIYWYVKITRRGYMEHGLKKYFVLCSKHIAHLTVCYNFPLVRDKPLGAPAFVKLLLVNRQDIPNVNCRWFWRTRDIRDQNYMLVPLVECPHYVTQKHVCCLYSPTCIWIITTEVYRGTVKSNQSQSVSVSFLRSRKNSWENDCYRYNYMS